MSWRTVESDEVVAGLYDEQTKRCLDVALGPSTSQTGVRTGNRTEHVRPRCEEINPHIIARLPWVLCLSFRFIICARPACNSCFQGRNSPRLIRRHLPYGGLCRKPWTRKARCGRLVRWKATGIIRRRCLLREDK